MGFLDDLGDSIVKGGRQAADWTKNTANTAKLSVDIRTREDDLEKAFAELGKKYYNEHKNDEDTSEFDAINSIYKEIDHLKNELAEKKGMQICPKCGAFVARDAKFCNECGEKLDLFTED